jgi:DNA-binding transcriptional MocR family regulator
MANDVLYVPGGMCYAADPSRRPPDHEMRVSFGGASDANIREGITRLGVALRTPLPPASSRRGARSPLHRTAAPERD